MDKKTPISLNLPDETVGKLDRVCRYLNLKRPAVIQMLFSNDPPTVDYIVDILKRINNEK